MSRDQFNAVLQAGELEWLQISKSDAPQARVAETKLATALELCRIAKHKPRNLHLFAEITRKAAELSVARCSFLLPGALLATIIGPPLGLMFPAGVLGFRPYI